MPERGERPQAILRYAEDYIEELLHIIATQLKPRVEVKVEEEKAESQRIRVVIILPSGERVESVEETPKLFSVSMPSLEQAEAKSPPQNIRPTLTLENEISAEVELPSLIKSTFPHIRSVFAFTIVNSSVGRLLPLNLLYISLTNFYSWIRDLNEPLSLPKQSGITAFTPRQLLRLAEIPLSFPAIKKVEVSAKLPVLLAERFHVQQPVKAKLTKAIEALQGIAQAQQLKGVGLLEILMPEERDKLRHFLGASGEYAGEPVIIILPESGYHLWYLFWIACREIYREVRGEYPEPVVLLKEDEKGVEAWFRVHGYISGKIVVLREESITESLFPLFERRLKEAFSQGLGFLILIAKDVYTAKERVESLCKPYMPRICELLEVPELNVLRDRLAKVLSMTFGAPCEKREIGGLDPDAVISAIDRMYREFVDELLSSNYIAYVRRDVGERESEDHIAMKTLVVKDLHERFDVKLEDINCTCEVGANVVADIYVKSEALAIECETVLGVAPAPLLKIFESVRKYIETSVSKIWVVIRNWPATLHLGDLYWAETILREELKRQNKNVKFFIPNICAKTLIPVDEIVKGLAIR